MFKRKSKKEVNAESGVVTLPMLNGTGNPELRAKLQTEIRYCATCNYQIVNPMTDKCPRCFSHVELSEHTNCGECSHQGNCTFAHPPGINHGK